MERYIFCEKNVGVDWNIYDSVELLRQNEYEPGHSISFKIGCAPIQDSDQPAHPRTLSKTFVVRLTKAWLFGFP